MRRLPFVNSAKIAVAGWSHGAWTIMDTFALEGSNELPSSLSDSPGGLEGVVGSVLIYPYCGALSLSHSETEWAGTVPSLMLLAGKDQMVSPDECLEVARWLEDEGQSVSVHVYPDADHAFDYTDLKPDSPLSYDPETTADAQKRVADFLRSTLASGI
jgi:dienelactone hydrolase